MCIIAIKSKGVAMPDERTLRTMWTNNPHGAGIMYAGKDGKVYIDKGYMDWTSFIERLRTLGTPAQVREMGVVLHFRIATHGGVNPGNTHPFPVSSSVSALTKLRGTCKVGVAHNGIIPIEPRDGISDTMEFVASELAPLAAKNPAWYTDPETMAAIGRRIRSKLAVLDGAGNVAYYGDFIQEPDGMIYSNTSFRPRTSAVVPFRSSAPFRVLDEKDELPAFDTGRAPVWLMPVNECDCGGVRYVRGKKAVVDDDYDLWCTRRGKVYSIDYDTAVAYLLPELMCVRPPFFSLRDACRFEDGGVEKWPF